MSHYNLQQVLSKFAELSFVYFIFYLSINKLMLKVNDILDMKNKKSMWSICSTSLFAPFLTLAFIIVLKINLKPDFVYYTVQAISVIGSFLIINFLYIAISFTLSTKKELKSFGIENKKFYEDIYMVKYPILLIAYGIFLIATKNNELIKSFSLCFYILIYGYHRTYKFLGNIKYTYIDNFIVKDIEKYLKVNKK